MQDRANIPRRPEWMLFVVLGLVGLALEPGLFAIGPMIGEVQGSIDLSDTQIGLLAAVPTLFMGLTAILGGRLADGWGAERTIALGLACIAIGGGLRGVSDSVLGLFLWSMLFGAGMGITFSATPSVVRRWFPSRLGLANAIYTLGMLAGLITASGISGTVLSPWLGGWGNVLILWGVVAAVVLVIWMIVATPWTFGPPPATPGSPTDASWNPLKVKAVWALTVLYAGQGLTYFLLAIWTPVLYEEAGLSSSGAAWRVMLITVACLPASFLLPVISDRIGSRRGPMVFSSLMMLIGSIGFYLAPAHPVLGWLWPFCAGFGASGILVIGLIRIAEVAPLGQTGEASAMVMSIGYVLTAIGPALAGVLRQATGDLHQAMLFELLVAAVMIPFALSTPKRAGMDYPTDA